MNAAGIDREGLLSRLVAAGALPAGARWPQQTHRPWPVVLLTALGAWLAALPLLGFLALLLGQLFDKGPALYVVSPLLLCVAVVVLRRPGLPVFLEQVAIPVLLMGGGALAYALDRDLGARSASAVMLGVTLGMALAVPRAWLRALLGAVALVLFVTLVSPLGGSTRGGWDRAWLALHIALALGLAAWWLQGRRPVQAPAPTALLLEPLVAGWMLGTLAGLAWWAGMTFLLGGAMPLHEGRAPRIGQPVLLGAMSAVLALLAAGHTARRWPATRKPLVLATAFAPTLLAAWMPTLGAVCLALAAAAVQRRWRLAGAAGAAAVWVIGAFYYQLDWPLGHKALLLVATGALLAALLWLGREQRGPAAASAQASSTWSVAGVGLTLCAVLSVANVGIWKKQDLIARGQPVYLELAPVDPRSLMQGDYMRLNFRLPREVLDVPIRSPGTPRPRVIAQRDANGVARVLGLDNGRALAPNELRVELTPKDGRWMVVTDAWFFEEGQAQRYEAARYGEFRVLPDGRALLVGLRDAQLKPL